MDELQVTLDNLQKASGNMQLASTNLPGISDAIGKEAKDLPGLVLQTQASVRELDQGKMHVLNISTEPGLASMKIEKRCLWLPVPQDFAAHLPC